jgi:hypothetical protein
MGKKEKNFMEKIPSLQETILWNRQWIVYKLFIRIYFLKFEFGHHIMHECENSTSAYSFSGHSRGPPPNGTKVYGAGPLRRIELLWIREILQIFVG